MQKQVNFADEDDIMYSDSDGGSGEDQNAMAQFNNELGAITGMIDTQGTKTEYDEKDGSKNRSRRRSKNDNSGRDYKCGCGKRYLSYPALYTHIKQKHAGRTPQGTKVSDLTTGRGRGRPKKIHIDDKNFHVMNDPNLLYDESAEIDIFNPTLMKDIEPSQYDLRK